MGSRRRPTTPELDAALTGLMGAVAALSPAERSMLVASMPAKLRAQVDQLDAAATQTRDLLAMALGETPRMVAPGEIPDWLRLGAVDAYRQWFNGDARTCMHSPREDRPEPVWSCAWKPGLITCTRCTHLLQAVGAKDKTCDACGRVTTGPEHGDGIYVLSTVLGALVHQAGACRDCMPPELVTCMWPWTGCSSVRRPSKTGWPHGI
jgi:hypothetical protein